MTHEELVERVAAVIRNRLVTITHTQSFSAAQDAIAAVAEAIREPTQDIVDAYWLSGGIKVEETEWRAMLAASPLAPKEGGECA